MQTIILFGATGNLAQRKLYEAWYLLNTPDQPVALMGVAKSSLTQKEYLELVQKAIPNLSKEKWNQVKQNIQYWQISELESDDYAEFTQALKRVSSSHESKIFYFAIPTPAIQPLVKKLFEKKIIEKGNNSHCIALEKPFGQNGKDSAELYASISPYVNSSQTYNIDHYLAKNVLQEFFYQRINNPAISKFWNKKYIDHIQICILENYGVKGRAGYFDSTGTVRDMIQNHILLIMSMIAAEPSLSSAKDTRKNRLSVLKDIKPLSNKDIVVAQYKGYTNDKGINPFSQTETFAAAKFEIKNNEWEGVPFYVKTGKSLAHTWTGILVKFKDKCDIDYVLVQMKPRERIQIEHTLTRKKEMLYDNSSPTYGKQYELILKNMFAGKKDTSLDEEEITQLWRIVDSLRLSILNIPKYDAHSEGPIEAIHFIRKDKRVWVDEEIFFTFIQ